MDLLIAPGTVTEDKADTAPEAGIPGFATDGDPSTQTPRTVFPAYIFNAILKEFRAVILAAGLKMDRNDTTQLLQALRIITIGSNTQDWADGRYVRSNGLANAQSGLTIHVAWPTDDTAKTTGWRPLLQVEENYIGALALYSDVAAEILRATTIESNLLQRIAKEEQNRAADKVALDGRIDGKQDSATAVSTYTQTSGTSGNLRLDTLAYSNEAGGVFAGGYNPAGERSSYLLAQRSELPIFTALSGPNGYEISPSGIIRQWGFLSASGVNFSFPITFPNQCFGVKATTTTQGAYNDSASAQVIDKSTGWADTKASNGPWSHYPVFWEAIGH